MQREEFFRWFLVECHSCEPAFITPNQTSPEPNVVIVGARESSSMSCDRLGQSNVDLPFLVVTKGMCLEGDEQRVYCEDEAWVWIVVRSEDVGLRYQRDCKRHLENEFTS